MKASDFCSYEKYNPEFGVKVSCQNRPVVRFRFPDYAEGQWAYRCEEHEKFLYVQIQPILCEAKFVSKDLDKTFVCQRHRDHSSYHYSGDAAWGFPPPARKAEFLEYGESSPGVPE